MYGLRSLSGSPCPTWAIKASVGGVSREASAAKMIGYVLTG